MKRNLVRRIVRGLSLTSAMFIFQACYGTPQDLGYDLFVEGVVKSRKTGSPVQGIKVSDSDLMRYTTTDDQGRFSFYTEKRGTVKIKFEDVDAAQNGVFAASDTLLNVTSDEVFINISLVEN